ncbi:MAG: mannose-1-phosphate guanylyltransferase/mannose-6-phosphate isomerase, partial [Paracoccaceae bacterium]
AVLTGAEAAEVGRIVTFGIAPTRAETGYGWLETGAGIAPGVVVLDRFVEKPDAARAAELLGDSRYLWNAGVFLARADVLIAAFRAHAPEVLAAAEASVAAAEADLGFLRLDGIAWAEAPSISIDYAVMEKAGNLAAVRFDGQWSDLGSWTAVWQESARDGAGNATHGNAVALDCQGSLLRSEVEGIELVGVGLRNIVAVAMDDAVLVADLTNTQGVKRAVEVLKAKGAKQATAFQTDHRPWGWFETLALGHRFQVKRIHVHPGAALSLQSHVHRAEHWVVVQGTARVTVGDAVRLVGENESVYIPLGVKHRMENPGKLPMVLIEVQSGSYLGEDDITRYEDRYARRTPGE